MAAEDNAKRRIGMHQGRVLVDQLADKYHTLMLAIVEMAQNAIDAQASTIFVGVNLRRLSVVVADNGTGINQAKFDQALMSVGQSVKEEGSLGRFGLGMIGPLNKCREFKIISQPVGDDYVLEWKFVGAEIREQHHDPNIPVRRLPQMPSMSQPFTQLAAQLEQPWRTMVILRDVTKDRTINEVRIDELSQHIRTKLWRGMRRYGTQVHVAIVDEAGNLTQKRVDPLEHVGAPIDVAVIDEPICGKVEFRLFRAPKRGERGDGVQVLRLDDNSAISWREFTIQAMGSRWLKEEPIKVAFEALGSGDFNGEIRIENAELDSDRSKFVLNDKLRAAYIAMGEWYARYGRSLYEDEREERRGARYKELGQLSIQKLYSTLAADPTFAAIAAYLVGTATGEERTPKDVDKEGARKSKRRIVAKHPDQRPSGGNSRPRDPRNLGKKANVKLSFAYEMLPESPNLWEYDPNTVTLVFNLRHPVWVECDNVEGKPSTKHNRQVMHLQEYVALQVLLLLSRCSDVAELETVRWSLDHQIRLYVKMFILNK